MLTTLVPEFLKNVFGLLESSNGTKAVNTDEKVIRYIFDFVAKIFKNAEGSLGRMRLSKDLKKSILDDLLLINEDLLNTVAYLEPKMKTTIENLSLRMKFSNVSCMSRSVFDDNDGGVLISLNEPEVFDSIKYFRAADSVERYNNPVHDSSISASVSFDSTLTPNHFRAGELGVELRDYKVHCLTVPKYILSNHVSIARAVKEMLNIAVLELSELVLVEGNLAIDKMLWHSVVNEASAYKCLVCSEEMTNMNYYNDHIVTPLHLSQLSNKKIWIPSSEICANIIDDKNRIIQCCICSGVTDILDMENHLKSSRHMQNNRANDVCRTILSQMKPGTLKEQMIGSKVFADTFKDLLDQHQIDINEKEITCGICDAAIPSYPLENLYIHISGNKHRKLYDNCLRSKFEKIRTTSILSHTLGKSYRGFIHIYQNKNMSYCTICNVLIEGASIDNVNMHIASISHSSLLILYLTNHKFTPLKNLNINKDLDANKDLEPYKPKINQFMNIQVPKIKVNNPICEPKLTIETSKKVVLDCGIVIEKYSWHVMTLGHYEYNCKPCCLCVDIKNFEKHISLDMHIENVKNWNIIRGYPMIKKENNCDATFCMLCKEFLEESARLRHTDSEDHKKQLERFTVDPKELKRVMDKII